MIEHSRLVAPGHDVDATEEHVRAHLSAVADADDDPDTHAGDVDVQRLTAENGWTRVVGRLDAEPQVVYFADDFDPYAGVPEELRAEAARNG